VAVMAGAEFICFGKLMHLPRNPRRKASDSSNVQGSASVL
jgi:hypothetical protein